MSIKNTKNNIQHFAMVFLASALVVSVLFSVLAVTSQLWVPRAAATPSTTVSGWIYYTDLDGINKPTRDANVEVYHSEFGFDDFLGEDWTGADGYFRVAFAGGCDCYIKVFSHSGIAKVESEVLGHSYDARSNTVSINEGQDYSFGTLVPSGDTNEALRIFTAIVEAWVYIRDQTGIQLPQVQVIWPCGILQCPAGRPWFDPFGAETPTTREGQIYLKSGEPRDTIVHEYGHYVMWYAYGHQWPVPFSIYCDTDWTVCDWSNCALNHNLQSFCTYRIGWTEGWADFLPVAVFLNADQDVTLGRGGAGFDIDLDTLCYPNDPSRCFDIEDGGGVEGNVAAALWDLYDGRIGDTCDNFTTGLDLSPIFMTLYSAHPSTFREFYDAFKGIYPNYSDDIHGAAFQNTINYELGPPSVRVVQPTPGAWYSGFIRPSEEISDPDGTPGDRVFLEYSTDGITWAVAEIQPLGWDTTRVRVEGNLQALNDATVWIKARASDELFCYTGLISEDISGPFGIDNTSPSNPTDFSSSHEPEVWSNDNTIEMTWSGATDGLSGIKGYWTGFFDNEITAGPSFGPCSGYPGPIGSFTSDTSTVGPSLSTGTWYFSIAAEDNAGNCAGGHAIRFLIDIDPPSAPVLVDPSFQERTSTQPVLEWSQASDPHSGVASYNLQLTNRIICSPLACLPDAPDWLDPDLPVIQVDYLPASPTVTYLSGPLSSGTWFWRVQAVDNAGNPGSWAEGRFTVDAPPVITVTDVTEEATGPSGATVDYAVTAQDDFDAVVTVGCDPISGSTFELGQTTVNCSATDSFGNTATASFAVTVQDTTPPDTVIVAAVDGNGASLASGALTLFQSITITSSGSDLVGIATLECSLDGLAFSTCPSTVDYGDLALGTHIFQVRAIDTSGNTDPTPSGFTWTIITPAEALQILSDATSGMDLRQGVERSLLGLLIGSAQLLGDSNTANDLGVCYQLGTFIMRVDDYEMRGALTLAQAAELRQQAENIRARLGCS